MINLETRTAILRLREEGHGTRTIAKALGISRETVKRTLGSGPASVEGTSRESSLDPYLEAVTTLEKICEGNLVRVWEELKVRHQVEIPYSTLTHFCRKHKIGVEPKKAAGRYHFPAGQEMQHDTSPHRVTVGGRELALQCASLVMCFSRRRFIQCYPRWNRFLARVFLTRAIVALGGAAGRCMLDNSTVLVKGTGAHARAVPELVSFEKHFGFEFVAHEVGDADRSGRVERPFYHVETNFYPGRTFSDLQDLNTQLAAWCSDYNGRYNKNLGFIPDEMGAAEKPYQRPLPLWNPEPVEVHPRKVDVEGYIQLHSNRYSLEEEQIGQGVEVHESYEEVKIHLGHKLLCTHRKLPDGQGGRVTLPEHQRHWERYRRPPEPSPEEIQLRALSSDYDRICDVLRKRYGGQALKGMRRLHRMWTDYPDAALTGALRHALDHDLTDLDRIETMVLRNIRSDFFKLPETDHG